MKLTKTIKPSNINIKKRDSTKKLLLGIIIPLFLSSCELADSDPNKSAKVKIIRNCGIYDTININYYKELYIWNRNLLIDENSNTFATDITSFSILEQKDLK